VSGTWSLPTRLSLRIESAFTCHVLSGTVILLLPTFSLENAALHLNNVAPDTPKWERPQPTTLTGTLWWMQS